LWRKNKILSIIIFMKTSQQPQSHNRSAIPQNARWGLVISLVAVLALAGGYIAFAKYQFLWPFSRPVAVVISTPTVSPSPLPSATQDPTIGWKTFQNVAEGFTYRYPPELTADKTHPVAVETISDFRTLYSPASFPDGCPSICGSLLDPQTLANQFSILLQAQTCEVSDSFKEDVKKNFILFGAGIYSIIDVEKVYSPTLKICGLKILDYGSFIVDLNDYGYKDVFLSGDKVIVVAISPFALSEADTIWDGLGRIETGGGWGCDAACGEKMVTYYNQVSDAPLANPIIQIGGNRVDQILSTFHFT
jgi:hypothetical protein